MTTKNKAEWRKATLPEKEDKIMEERAMTGEEVLQEIMRRSILCNSICEQRINQ